jgi:hypothetical protein
VEPPWKSRKVSFSMRAPALLRYSVSTMLCTTLPLGHTGCTPLDWPANIAVLVLCTAGRKGKMPNLLYNNISELSRGRFGSLALPFAVATRPCVGRARTSRRVPPAGLRCAGSPSPRLRLFRPVSCPVCGFGVSGSASLCVA